MKKYGVGISCTSGFDTEDYLEVKEEDIDYKRAIELFDAFPWKEEIYALEYGSGIGGGVSLGKSGLSEYSYAYINIHPTEEGKVTLDCGVVLKPKFLGMFGGKESSKSFEDVSHNEAKNIFKVIFNRDLEGLYAYYA